MQPSRPTTSRLTLLALATALTALALLPRCSDTTAGSGSETQNPAVAGVFYRPDGVTPAASVQVCIRLRSTLGDSGTVHCVTTDANGRYEFDTLDVGVYMVVGNDGADNLALIDSVTVTNPDHTHDLPPDTLKPAGAIEGIAYLSEGHDPRTVLIYAFGLGRYTMAGSNGAFRLTGLAEASYDLRLVSTLDVYGVLDVPRVRVAAADTTDLDTLELPFLGIPTPKDVRLSYDTMMQVVTLTWDRADTGLVASYNVYRRNVGLNSVSERINVSPVTDTVYSDSGATQDSIYEYALTCENTAGTEGSRSVASAVYIASVFMMTDSIVKGTGTADGQFGGLVRSVRDAQGNYYIVDTGNRRLQKLDATGQFVYKVTVGPWPRGIAIDDTGNLLYVSDGVQKRVLKFLTTGDTAGSWSTAHIPGGLAFHGSRVYVALPDTGVQSYDANGTALVFYPYRLRSHNSDCGDFAQDEQGRLYVTDAENILALDTSTGVFTAVHRIGPSDENQDPNMEFLSGDTIMMVTRGAVTPFNSTLYLVSVGLGAVLARGYSHEGLVHVVRDADRSGVHLTAASGKVFGVRVRPRM